jgi:hypothetical protein
MFAVILEVEIVLIFALCILHFASQDAYIRDSFDSVISKMSEMKVHRICCELHRKNLHLVSYTSTSLFVIGSKANGKNTNRLQKQPLSVIPKENCRRYRNRIKKTSKVVAQLDLRNKKNDAKNTLVQKDSKIIPVKNDAKIVHQKDQKKKEISQKKQGKLKKKQEQAAKADSVRHTQMNLSKISQQDKQIFKSRCSIGCDKKKRIMPK